MKKNISLAVLAVSILGLSACLKDKNLVLDPAKSPSTVGFSTIEDNPVSITDGVTLYSRAFDIVPAGVNSAFGISYGGGVAAPGDVTVDVALDQAALDKYNQAHPDDDPYQILPESQYTIASKTVTIKSGEKKGFMNVLFKTASFDLTTSYVLPLTIKSTSKGNISGNYGTVLYIIGAKNQYDGVYTLKGVLYRDGLTDALAGKIKSGVTVNLATTSANSVSFDQVWADGGGLAGLNPVNLTVNSTSNAVSPASTVSNITSLPGYSNRYDPATKTFYISIIWGGTDFNHRSAVDTLTYKGPRP